MISSLGHVFVGNDSSPTRDPRSWDRINEQASPAEEENSRPLLPFGSYIAIAISTRSPFELDISPHHISPTSLVLVLNTLNTMSNNPLRRPATSPSDNLAGRLAMTIGRALDPTLAYALLRNGVAGKLLQTIGLKRIITLPLVTRVGLNTDFFGAGLLDKPGNMLLTMNAITALRHVGSCPI